jgi:hypothetical protein
MLIVAAYTSMYMCAHSFKDSPKLRKGRTPRPHPTPLRRHLPHPLPRRRRFQLATTLHSEQKAASPREISLSFARSRSVSLALSSLSLSSPQNSSAVSEIEFSGYRMTIYFEWLFPLCARHCKVSPLYHSPVPRSRSHSHSLSLAVSPQSSKR